MTRNWSLAGLLIGLGLLVVAVVIGYDAAQMRVPPIHAKVGPRVFPVIVSIGLAICGLALVWQSRSKTSFPDAEGDTDWMAIAVIAAGLIVHMNILKPLGFVPAGVLLFMSVAFAFGSRKFARDGIIALIVVLITYVSFTRLLGLQLPPGILMGIF
jgi:putative tricarboxylic transport membrane protein